MYSHYARTNSSPDGSIITEHTNKTFMLTRNIFNSIGMQQASWYDFGYKPHQLGSALQISMTYGQSFENKTSPEYFLFDHKKELSIKGGTNPSEFTLTARGWSPKNPMQDEITTKSFNRDILGQWFDAPEVIESTFTVKPFQRQASGVIEFNQDLKEIVGSPAADLWYLGIKLPITYVSNELGLQGDQRAIDALTNNNFSYANFSQCEMNLIRLSNIQLTMGTKYLNDRDTHIITGFGVSIPFVEQNSNIYLFEPLNGYNAHFGLTSLALFQFPVLRKHANSHSRVCFFLEFENNFLARNHQYRTYDLVDKPYSRYMKLLDRKTNSVLPATNVLTIRSRVEPFNIFDMATGFRFKYGASTGEIGYELWAHSSEVVTPEPELPWDDNRYGIAFIDQDGDLAKVIENPMMANQYIIEKIDTNTETGRTASNSTINFVAPPDGEVTCCGTTFTFAPRNKYISLHDLDIISAGAGSAITHRAYATIGVGQKGKTRDFFANIGLYIEASQNNAALSFWGGWAKMGINF
tara:strand:- start:3901 stop:5469 length:1569 start_codon:yes stop_codon:yes gene_type:complete